MSTDLAEKEREFIAALAEDTGRDLAGWMAAIGETGLRQRNDIIDWLRHQGFQFQWASWLERIHHNDGRLIYADTGNQPRTASRQPSPRDSGRDSGRYPARDAGDEPPARARPFRDLKPQPPPAAPTQPPVIGDPIQHLLSDAKGLRPLAEHVLREVGRAVPTTEFAATATFVMMSAPTPFAALHAGPKKLRLYANFGPAGVNRSIPAEPANKSAPPFREMLVLDDVRNVDEDFQRLIRAAAAR
ncbi:hypothetical protein [Hyphomicrobium facile]|uniref:DUF5655 domain-containing protein n=1 Tax=Hyphomicrobium facile TaxID=51670 RepID=A0A1I7N1Z0_9HYPH|nr:hypothetical protein [Hyphomicrobium facile]SFV28679.1 hypothetical protein SAMN04488557_1066 [Hyphomicrobium facile]